MRMVGGGGQAPTAQPDEHPHHPPHDGHPDDAQDRLGDDAGGFPALSIWTPSTAIGCGVEGYLKWAGITECGSLLYCAPFEACFVLVIDPQTRTTSTIECGVGGQYKWWGIAESNGLLCCAPANSTTVLQVPTF